MGLGFLPVGFGFFHVFLNFLAMLTSCSCYLNLCAFQFLYKIPKKLLYVLEAFLYCFVMLLHVKIDKKNEYAFLLHIHIFLCVLLVNFLHNFRANSIPYDLNAWGTIL